MNLIIETDLGHDPDDFFAICYLISAGVNIRHISICPGDPDQVALADMIRQFTDQNFTIGVSHANRTEPSSGGVHHKLLNRFGYPLHAVPEGLGEDLISGTLNEIAYDNEDCEALVIGPPTCLGQYIASNLETFKAKPPISHATIQGGFLAYHHHNFPCLRLPKFEGKSWMPTFNLNGDRKGAVALAESGIRLSYVCKNVCHTVEFNRDRFSEFFAKPSCPASELFMEAGELYFQKHDSKKFHDPTAAVCHLHPEIADWVLGHMVKMEGGWGAIPDPSGHPIIADIDYEMLWEHLREMN
jgi:pyrimidine-specific ribonucleoside hydrolase